MRRYETRGKALHLELVEFSQFQTAKRAEIPARRWPDVALVAAFLLVGAVFLVAFVAAAPGIRLFFGVAGDVCVTLLGFGHG